MNEMQIIVNQQQGVISTNFDDVKGALTTQMEIYKELDVTEENKAERKKDVATLRKIIKAINDKRIEVKKECLKPYDAFEQQATELVNIINEPVRLIDGQVKEFEEKQRLEKINAINQIFAELVGELEEHISIDRIYDSKWENVATSTKSIREDITLKLNEIRNGAAVIKDMRSEKSEEALNRYYDSLDLAASISFINRYEQQKREIELRLAEQQKKDQAEAIEREVERAKKAEREAIDREKQAAQAEREAMVVKQTGGAIEQRLYGIEATTEEFEQIEMYLNSLGLSFERI